MCCVASCVAGGQVFFGQVITRMLIPPLCMFFFVKVLVIVGFPGTCVLAHLQFFLVWGWKGVVLQTFALLETNLETPKGPYTDYSPSKRGLYGLPC